MRKIPNKKDILPIKMSGFGAAFLMKSVAHTSIFPYIQLRLNQKLTMKVVQI